MTINELHKELIGAYSVDNLNTISLTLINLFKNQQYSALQKISEMIIDYVDARVTDNGKGFYKLMMLYHPDRAVYHITEINRLAAENNFDGLLMYSHILKLERINEIATALNSYEDIDYSPVYDWDMEDLAEEGFRIFDVNDPPEYTVPRETDQAGYTFYDALMIKEFGEVEAEYPFIFLENEENFELSSSDINDLYGIQYCIHARTIDLSNNRISDLLPLIGLRELEELDLSDNEVGFIDDISNLKRLRSVVLSNNFIEDITPLFELKGLEYADLSGNNIDIDQIRRLKDRGVTVDF